MSKIILQTQKKIHIPVNEAVYNAFTRWRKEKENGYYLASEAIIEHYDKKRRPSTSLSQLRSYYTLSNTLSKENPQLSAKKNIAAYLPPETASKLLEDSELHLRKQGMQALFILIPLLNEAINDSL